MSRRATKSVTSRGGDDDDDEDWVSERNYSRVKSVVDSSSSAAEKGHDAAPAKMTESGEGDVDDENLTTPSQTKPPPPPKSFFNNIAALTKNVIDLEDDQDIYNRNSQNAEHYVVSMFKSEGEKEGFVYHQRNNEMKEQQRKYGRQSKEFSRAERSWGERVSGEKTEHEKLMLANMTTMPRNERKSYFEVDAKRRKNRSNSEKEENGKGLNLPPEYYARKNGVFVISPMGSFMRRWDVLIIGALLWTAVVTPAEVAFTKPTLKTNTGIVLFFLNRVIDAFFITDIFINFVLAIPEAQTGHIVYDRRYIARMYLRTWFLIDFLSVIPTDMITIIVDSEKIQNLTLLRALRLFRLAKLLRILRTMRLFKRLEMRYTIDYSMLALSKFAIITVVLAHWMACAFGFVHDLGQNAGLDTWLESTYFGCVAELTPEEEAEDKLGCVPLFDRYIASLYWSSMTITTIGYGDIQPKTTEERIFVIIAMLAGAFQYGYVVGAVGNVIATKNARSSGLKNILTDLNELFEDLPSTPQEMRVKLREFFKYRLGDKKSDEAKTSALMSVMSPKLRAELVVLQNMWMRDVDFFHAFPESLVLSLSLKIMPQTYPPKELILEKGDYLDRFYMIRRGVVIVNGRIVTAGQVIGEEFILDPGRSTIIVQTITFSDIYTLSYEDLEVELKHYPDVQRLLRRRKIRAKMRRELMAYTRAHNALMLYGEKSDLYCWYDERPEFYLQKLKIIYGADGGGIINPEGETAQLRTRAVLTMQKYFRSKRTREKFKNLAASMCVAPVLSSNLKSSNPTRYISAAIDVLHHRTLVSLKMIHHKLDSILALELPGKSERKFEEIQELSKSSSGYWGLTSMPSHQNTTLFRLLKSKMQEDEEKS